MCHYLHIWINTVTTTLVRALNVLTPSSMALSMSSITLSVDPRMTMVDTALSSESESKSQYLIYA